MVGVTWCHLHGIVLAKIYKKRGDTRYWIHVWTSSYWVDHAVHGANRNQYLSIYFNPILYWKNDPLGTALYLWGGV